MSTTIENYKSLLEDACYKGDIEKVRELLKLNPIRITTQLITKDNDHFEKVNELLSQSPAIDNTYKNGTAGLVITSNQSNFEELVHKLVSLGVEIDEIESFVYEPIPLLLASMYGHLEVVRELLSQGAKVDAADNNGFTPLYVACYNGHLEVVRELLSWSPNVNPLLLPSMYGHLDVVRELLSQGAKVDAADNNGLTPLHVACYNGHLEVVRELLSWSPNVNASDNKGLTPLGAASKKFHMKVVVELFEWSALHNVVIS